MKPKVKLCKDIIKKYKQIEDKKKQSRELLTKYNRLFYQAKGDPRLGRKPQPEVFRLCSHVKDESYVVQHTIENLEKEFAELMLEFEKVIKQKDTTSTNEEDS